MGLKYEDLTQGAAGEGFRIEKTKDCSSEIISIKTPSGWRVMDSPFNPIKEATGEVKACGLFEEKVLVLGAGSGFLADEILKMRPKRVLIITACMPVADRNINHIMSNYSQHIDIELLLSYTVNDSLINKIEEFLLETAPILIKHQRELYAFPSFFTPLQVLIESRMHPVAYIPRKTMPEKMLFPRSRRGLIEDEIISAFNGAGIEVVETESFHAGQIKTGEVFDMLNNIKPDMIFSINDDGSDPYSVVPLVCERADIPWGTWFVDDPRFIVSKHEKGLISKRHNFCWDISGIEACCELDLGNNILLPLATNPVQFQSGSPDESLKGRVVFVGKPCFGSEEKYFAPLYNNPEALLIADTLRNEILARRKPPQVDDVVRVIDGLGIEPDIFSQETMRRIPAFCLYRANIWYRTEGLKKISSLNPVVIGEGWEGLLPPDIELRRPVDYYSGLADVYCSDAVHLSFTHLQMRMFPNQRVFDIGASGGMIINEKLDGWNQLFGNLLDEVTYENFDELYEKTLFFLNNPKKRKDISMLLKEIVLSKHTYKHRLEKIFNSIAC